MKNIKTLLVVGCVASLLGCGGGGGGSSPPVYPSPKSVEATSYGNKHDIVLDNTQVTALSGSDGHTVAFGDFFQEGEYSAFVTVAAGGANEARFLKKSGSTWTDHTTSLQFGGIAINVCSNIAQAITADFNGDGKPDVFLACGMSTASEQHIVMSQSGSTTYARQIIKNISGQAIPLQGWGAAAADVDGDGDIDIVMAQGNEVVALENKNTYWVLHSAANSNAWMALPSALNFPTVPRKVFLIPGAGARPDLVVGGDGTMGNITLAWMQNLNANGAPFYRFNSNSSESSYANAYLMPNNYSASIYDVAKKGANLLVLAKDKNAANESTAGVMKILKYAMPSLSGGVYSVFPIPTEVNYNGTNTAPDFIFQFKLDSSGRLVAYDGACVSTQTRCSFIATP